MEPFRITRASRGRSAYSSAESVAYSRACELLPLTGFSQRLLVEQVLQDLQQSFLAFLLTVLVHFVFNIRPIVLLQIIAAPYHFVDNRLLKKHVLGLKRNYRVWGERFDGELEEDRIAEGSEVPGSAAASMDESAEVATAEAISGPEGAMPVVTARVVQVIGQVYFSGSDTDSVFDWNWFDGDLVFSGSIAFGSTAFESLLPCRCFPDKRE